MASVRPRQPVFGSWRRDKGVCKPNRPALARREQRRKDREQMKKRFNARGGTSLGLSVAQAHLGEMVIHPETGLPVPRAHIVDEIEERRHQAQDSETEEEEMDLETDDAESTWSADMELDSDDEQGEEQTRQAALLPLTTRGSGLASKTTASKTRARQSNVSPAGDAAPGPVADDNNSAASLPHYTLPHQKQARLLAEDAIPPPMHYFTNAPPTVSSSTQIPPNPQIDAQERHGPVRQARNTRCRPAIFRHQPTDFIIKTSDASFRVHSAVLKSFRYFRAMMDFGGVETQQGVVTLEMSHHTVKVLIHWMYGASINNLWHLTKADPSQLLETYPANALIPPCEDERGCLQRDSEGNRTTSFYSNKTDLVPREVADHHCRQLATIMDLVNLVHYLGVGDLLLSTMAKWFELLARDCMWSPPVLPLLWSAARLPDSLLLSPIARRTLALNLPLLFAEDAFVAHARMVQHSQLMSDILREFHLHEHVPHPAAINTRWCNSCRRNVKITWHRGQNVFSCPFCGSAFPPTTTTGVHTLGWTGPKQMGQYVDSWDSPIARLMVYAAEKAGFEETESASKAMREIAGRMLDVMQERRYAPNDPLREGAGTVMALDLEEAQRAPPKPTVVKIIEGGRSRRQRAARNRMRERLRRAAEDVGLDAAEFDGVQHP